MIDNALKYQELRDKYSTFRYVDFDYEITNVSLNIKYHFLIDDLAEFFPTWKFEIKQYQDYDFEKLKYLIFNLGMIELISYWKITCSKNVIINPNILLTIDQLNFFKKLYFNGLGEFFYTNNINTNINDFMSIKAKIGSYNLSSIKYKKANINSKVFVTIGGGKDSAVALEVLRDDADIYPFVINPSGSKIDCLDVSLLKDKAIYAYRSLDSKMLELNKEGYLNGHTPFSAIVAFASVLSGYLNGIDYVALSNESSANEPTIIGTNINHQYSKSFEFEKDFNLYENNYLRTGVYYFSLLRPLYEIQIAKMFSNLKEYYYAFKSCNVGQKQNIWCGHCPKCLFVYIILSPFIKQDILTKIFGNNLLNDLSLKEDFDKLVGFEIEKPFECVGERKEVIYSLNILHKKDIKGLALLDYYVSKTNDFKINDLLDYFDNNNLLPDYFKDVLIRKINQWKI